MENHLIRIKNKDIQLDNFINECFNWGLEFVTGFPFSGKLSDATFRIIDEKKYMLFLIKYPIKTYPPA